MAKTSFSETKKKQLVVSALEEVSKRIENGTVSSQLLTEVLRWGTENNKLEATKKQLEIELMRAKTDSIKSSSQSAIDYQKVIESMKTYRGEL